MDKMVCPKRPSGGPCIEAGCEIYHKNECSILSIAKSLYEMSENFKRLLEMMAPPIFKIPEGMREGDYANFSPGKVILRRTPEPEDDVPW